MAANAISSFCGAISAPPSSSLSSSARLSPHFFPFPKPSSSCSSAYACPSLRFSRPRKLRSFVVAAAAEVEETLDAESGAAQPEGDVVSPATTTDQTVSVTVSPSDVLTMLFQAEGSISDAAIPSVSKALEETEGVSDLKVQVAEGIATVQLTKQTTVQATGVASSLVELIQSKGFKLQTLNLSFQDEEDFS
ncbi:OLC1v1011221C1 [Oldenlandia corymbosa var. corymbosa]|uniref:OLC1v1011221C1 n=1 Tax=Oldenlandia corymbosa var. corymbosa TaxID=529605 RepID=A0AAV1DW57_OLDCO|nr:OLC1v1011221C1 [Oldenlandia corymbosa var. corymbosa]